MCDDFRVVSVPSSRFNRESHRVRRVIIDIAKIQWFKIINTDIKLTTSEAWCWKPISSRAKSESGAVSCVQREEDLQDYDSFKHYEGVHWLKSTQVMLSYSRIKS